MPKILKIIRKYFHRFVVDNLSKQSVFLCISTLPMHLLSVSHHFIRLFDLLSTFSTIYEYYESLQSRKKFGARTVHISENIQEGLDGRQIRC